MDKKRSWLCTLVAQVSLCIALYLAFNLGRPHMLVYQSRSGGSRPLDVYFISVRGGHRPLEQLTHLLKLMKNVAKMYRVRFVVNISELGEADPLTQNASRLFPPLHVPWYTTRVSEGWKGGGFQKQISIAHGNTFNIVGLDTWELQDITPMGSTNGFGNNQLNWLTQTLEASNGDCFMVVGYHPVVICEKKNEHKEAKQIHEPLHHIFMKYGVNAYISRQGCNGHLEDGVTYIGIPDPIETKPDYVSLDGGSSTSEKEMANGFLLHRVSPLEITTYFVTSTGEVVNRAVIQQSREEVM